MTTLSQSTDRNPDRRYELAVDLTTPTPTPEQVKACQIASNLIALAEFIRANPHLVRHLKYTVLDSPYGQTINIPISKEDDQRAAIAGFASAAARAGLAVTKKAMGTGDMLFGVVFEFGNISLQVFGDREKVCERVVTGTREVTEEVPDPEALAAVPKTTVTRTEEVVEWKCRPLLGDEPTGGAE